MDNNVQATRIAFSPEVVTLDNAGQMCIRDSLRIVVVQGRTDAQQQVGRADAVLRCV